MTNVIVQIANRISLNIFMSYSTQHTINIIYETLRMRTDRIQKPPGGAGFCWRWVKMEHGDTKPYFM